MFTPKRISTNRGTNKRKKSNITSRIEKEPEGAGSLVLGGD